MIRAIFLAATLLLLHITPLFSVDRSIVSLSPTSTEILFALGAGNRVVGVSSYCDYPPQVKHLPKVGDVKTKLEKVIALKPDKVVGVGNSSQVYHQLTNVDIDALVIRAPETIQELYDTILLIGDYIDASKEAHTLVAQLKKDLLSVSQPEPTKRPKVMVAIWYSPLMVAASESFINDMIRAAGGENVFDDQKGDFPKMNPETVLAKNPDIIFVGPSAVKNGVTKQPFITQTHAGKRGKVITTLNPDLISRPGPRFVDGVKAIKFYLK